MYESGRYNSSATYKSPLSDTPHFVVEVSSGIRRQPPAMGRVSSHATRTVPGACQQLSCPWNTHGDLYSPIGDEHFGESLRHGSFNGVLYSVVMSVM
jgi:hypothetical protein